MGRVAQAFNYCLRTDLNPEGRPCRMRALRNYLSWVFAFISLVCLWLVYKLTAWTFNPPYAGGSGKYGHSGFLSFGVWPSQGPRALLPLIVPALFSALAAVFGLAW